ncbi:dephospho-CoA kinase [Pseudoxanthomonas japonensis]|uniref:dephospho-CoA kinase n=1 Tax=Pseudoxanthomonas japonensis TaxID=69284 RepID=UPI00285D80BF|nr:dephospho-CoA kinase [Pseudoxanthomonas japonensis]MDR7069573.1 dephospho-CoA kinase [Pseudoxanthomonas japonensis]
MSEYFIGMTGGIASGKSALEKAFAAHDIVVADADVLAREVVQPGTPALAAVVERFGRDVLLPDGQLDRTALRQRVFGNDGERRALEVILHPAIRTRLLEICQRAVSPYAIAMIPLLTEGGGRRTYPWLRRILVVDTPAAVQKARLMQRDGIDEALADKMMAAQASRADRLALADDIVVNDGGIGHLLDAADALHARYLALAAAASAT